MFKLQSSEMYIWWNKSDIQMKWVSSPSEGLWLLDICAFNSSSEPLSLKF